MTWIKIGAYSRAARVSVQHSMVAIIEAYSNLRYVNAVDAMSPILFIRKEFTALALCR